MTDPAPDRREASLTQVVVVALLPSLIFSIGEGAIIPIIPTVAASMGAGLEFAGFIAGAIMIGQTVGNLPAGPVVARIGEKRAMLAGAGLAVIGTVVSTLAATAWLLLAGILVIGFSAAIFNLARHAFLTSYAPIRYRARVLSTLGGVFRAGFFIGPLLSAAVIAIAGLAHVAFWIFIVCAVLVVVVLLVAPDVERLAGGGGAASGGGREAGAGAESGAGSGAVDAVESSGVWPTIVRHRGVLLRLGIGSGLIALLRGARNVVLPLWGLSIGTDPALVALVIGVSGGIDFALFFTSGWIMDRFGRAWSAVPSMLGMGVGLIALAATHDLPTAEAWFIGLAIFTGVFNGIGSGIIMTLGADLAPQRSPAPFLGAWHFITDAASASVPVLIAAITALVSLAATVGTFGVLGLVGAAMMWRWIPRYVPRRW